MTYGEPFILQYRTGRVGVSGVEWVVRDRFGFRRTVWLADGEGTDGLLLTSLAHSVSYRVRDRDSDYKAMCHEDRDHAELLLKAWLADGRDAVIERRHVFDGGWLPVGRPFFTGQQERMLDRCEAFDAANPEPETDT